MKEITVELDNCPSKDLALCKTGGYVNLWLPKDGNVVYVFRSGSIGGQGKLGTIPAKYFGLFVSHLRQGLRYETQIVDVDVNRLRCKVKCALFSKQETEARLAQELDNAQKKFKSELEKPYKPTGSLLIRINLPKDTQLSEGQEFFLEKQPLEFYSRNAQILSISFVDANGKIVANKTNEPALIRSIIRAAISQCSMRFRVTSIQRPDFYVLKYIDSIEGKATVSFET
jgi:hypothetical protein